MKGRFLNFWKNGFLLGEPYALIDWHVVFHWNSPNRCIFLCPDNVTRFHMSSSLLNPDSEQFPFSQFPTIWLHKWKISFTEIFLRTTVHVSPWQRTVAVVTSTMCCSLSTCKPSYRWQDHDAANYKYFWCHPKELGKYDSAWQLMTAHDSSWHLMTAHDSRYKETLVPFHGESRWSK